MSDLAGLDFDALESAATFISTGSRVAYPFIVDAYFVNDPDPARHYILGRRMDPYGDPDQQVAVYLDPSDPTENNPDPNKRRQGILAFAWPQYVQALQDNDTYAIQMLSQDNRLKTFTNVGGMILADGVQETDEGYVARWIYSLRQGGKDQKHNVAVGMATVRKRKGGTGVDVETLRVDDAVVTSNIEQLKAAILAAYRPQQKIGTLAVYLRVLQYDATGQVIRVSMPGQASVSGGRFDLSDKRVGDRWAPRTAEEGISTFLASPVGNQLAKGPWGGAKVEVIPLSFFRFGEKTLERQRDVDQPFIIPPPEDNPGQTGGTGYSLSTVRLTAIQEEGTGSVLYHLATLARPVTGELYRLADVPTPNYAPEVEPAFAVLGGPRQPVSDPDAPLADRFAF